jgi:hypothetical protein
MVPVLLLVVLTFAGVKTVTPIPFNVYTFRFITRKPEAKKEYKTNGSKYGHTHNTGPSSRGPECSVRNL